MHRFSYVAYYSYLYYTTARKSIPALPFAALVLKAARSLGEKLLQSAALDATLPGALAPAAA